MALYYLIISMRPRQWVKNLLVFAGLLFSHHYGDFRMLMASVWAFVVFCMLSGSAYILNDWVDREADRLHPRKSKRPLAAGKIHPALALAFAFLLACVGLALAFALPTGFRHDSPFGMTALTYFLATLLYSFLFKDIAIVDIILLALGFVLRAIGGVVVLRGMGSEVPMTPWFIICVLFLSLFIATCKRRHELVSLRENAAEHRKSLEDYTVGFLDQLIAVSTSAAVISYALYLTTGLSDDGADLKMISTFPFVLFGIFRYLFLVYKCERGGEPETLVLKDKPLLLNTLLWLGAMVFLHRPAM